MAASAGSDYECVFSARGDEVRTPGEYVNVSTVACSTPAWRYTMAVPANMTLHLGNASVAP